MDGAARILSGVFGGIDLTGRRSELFIGSLFLVADVMTYGMRGAEPT